MDFLRNVSVSSEFQAPSASLDDLFPTQNTEVDVSLEWLSIFVEDCFSSTGNCIPPVSNVENKATTTTTTETTKPSSEMKPTHQISPPSLQKFVVPCKAARSKRKRVSSSSTALLSKTKHNSFSSTWSYNLQLTNSDPLLLQQSCWLADSELIVPQKEDNNSNKVVDDEKAVAVVVEHHQNQQQQQQQQQQQPRRCSHCLSQRTPQWRAGPLGPKTLCNACGVRYKSGRLLPEYRPAKSPTFVSYLHSNSHKKVMEMRTSLLSSIPSEQ